MIPLYDLNRTRKVPYVTFGLIALNVLVFLFEMQVLYTQGQEGLNRLFNAYGVKPIAVVAAFTGKDTVEVKEPVTVQTFFGPVERTQTKQIPVSLTGSLMAIFASLFLHGGWAHIIGNMWFLWIFGDNVEDLLGHVKYLVFYLLTGVAATLCHILFSMNSPIPTIGASGAVSGVLGAYLVAYPTARIVTILPIFIFLQIIEIPAFIFLFFWFFIQQLIPAMGSLSNEGAGVAFWAHIGGFVAGLAYTYFRTTGAPPPRGPGRYVEYRFIHR
jgi:membrane associated rhomboid family serine protease